MSTHTWLHPIHLPPALPVAVLATALALIPAVPGFAQSLQGDIDAAAPGDTVWVAPGDHTKAVTVNKAITLVAQGPGASRLAGLTGSLATVVGIDFDGNLAVGLVTLVTCGPGLVFVDCIFTGGIRGAVVQTGAQDVVFESCTFNNYIEAMALETGVGSLLLDQSQFLNCSVGVSTADTLSCGGGARAPAERCLDPGCGEIMFDGVLFDGGDNQVRIRGDYELTIRNSVLKQASVCALEAEGVRLVMDNTEINSVGGQGKGLLLRSVSGFIGRSEIFFWDVGIDIGDGGCSLYSDLDIGNTLENAADVSASLELANDLGNATWNLLLNQPEPVDAEFNYWGSRDCSAALDKISGQEVTQIINSAHTQIIDCTGTAVEPATWGRIKALYLGGQPDRP